MCFIFNRISMIKEGKILILSHKLEKGYVVIGNHHHFKGYTLFPCKEHKTELFQLDNSIKIKFLEEMKSSLLKELNKLP